MTEHDGVQHGVELNLTPPAARRLLGVPMHELAGGSSRSTTCSTAAR